MSDILLQLIDIMKDLNKSISMHIDNHNIKYADEMIQDIGSKLSDKLNMLAKEMENE